MTPSPGRLDPAGGPASRPGSPRLRPQPGRGADQQGADRDPAEVRQHAAGQSHRSPPGSARVSRAHVWAVSQSAAPGGAPSSEMEMPNLNFNLHKPRWYAKPAHEL